MKWAVIHLYIVILFRQNNWGFNIILGRIVVYKQGNQFSALFSNSYKCVIWHTQRVENVTWSACRTDVIITMFLLIWIYESLNHAWYWMNQQRSTFKTFDQLPATWISEDEIQLWDCEIDLLFSFWFYIFELIYNFVFSLCLFPPVKRLSSGKGLFFLSQQWLIYYSSLSRSGTLKISPFHVGISIDIVYVQILFCQEFLRYSLIDSWSSGLPWLL